MYYGKLNWIELRLGAGSFTKTVYSPADTTKWKGHVKFSKNNKADGKWHLYATKTLQAGNVYGNTPSVIRRQYRMYSTKKTIGGQSRQYYRNKFVYSISGFLSSLSDSVFSGVVNKDQRKYFCEGYTHSNQGRGTIPAPTSFGITYEDFDTQKVDGKTQQYSYSRSTKGYIKRNRVRSNLVTLDVTWGHLTATEAANVLKALSTTQYIKVNYHDPIENANISKVMFTSSRNITSIVRGEYMDLIVTLTQV